MPARKPFPVEAHDEMAKQLQRSILGDKLKLEREKVRLVVLAALASGRSLIAIKRILKAITPAERKIFQTLSKGDQQLFEVVMRGGRERSQKSGMALTLDMDMSAILALASGPAAEG
jgi:hypothetical protein